MFPQIFWVYFCDISWINERKGWTDIGRVLITITLLWNKESVGTLKSPQSPIEEFLVDDFPNGLLKVTKVTMKCKEDGGNNHISTPNLLLRESLTQPVEALRTGDG